MKHINKLLFALTVLVLSSCSDAFDLDVNTNPNAVAPENAELGFLYNQVQLDLEDFVSGTWYPAGTASRMRTMTSFFYNEAYSPTGFNGIWTEGYANLIPDLDAIVARASE